jgi:hypothetical protein
MMKKPTGRILYRGPSVLDGAPIVAIATLGTTNAKTSAMVQTWILREGIAPHEATKTGDDSSVCGNCRHRPVNAGTCYVTVFQAPLSVWKAYGRGAYPDATAPAAAAELGAGRMVRLGAYGDPAAVPSRVWQALISRSAGWTGYTHQWQRPDFDRAIGELCMASADSPEDATLARARGMRYFRVRRADEPLRAREFACPASPEGGNRRTCATCKACNGAGRGASPVIIVHGARAGRF